MIHCVVCLLSFLLLFIPSLVRADEQEDVTDDRSGWRLRNGAEIVDSEHDPDGKVLRFTQDKDESQLAGYYRFRVKRHAARLEVKYKARAIAGTPHEAGDFNAWLQYDISNYSHYNQTGNTLPADDKAEEFTLTWTEFPGINVHVVFYSAPGDRVIEIDDLTFTMYDDDGEVID